MGIYVWNGWHFNCLQGWIFSFAKVCKMLPKWHHRLVYPSSYVTPCLKEAIKKKKKRGYYGRWWGRGGGGMTSLLQGSNLHVIKRKFREKSIARRALQWTYWGGRRNRGAWRERERELSEASEDFSNIEILWDNCELVSLREQGRLIIMFGGFKIPFDICFLFLFSYNFLLTNQTDRLILELQRNPSWPT